MAGRSQPSIGHEMKKSSCETARAQEDEHQPQWRLKPSISNPNLGNGGILGTVAVDDLGVGIVWSSLADALSRKLRLFF